MQVLHKYLHIHSILRFFRSVHHGSLHMGMQHSVQIHALHTPFGDIFLSESPDMVYWGRHRHMMGNNSGNWWENVKIGGGAAPIETTEGWLLFYHGVTGTCNGYVYSIGGAILDIDNPSVVNASPT